MPWPDEKLERRVERVDHPHVAWQHRRIGDRAEGSVDLTRFDGGHRHPRVVDLEGHHVELDVGVHPPILVQDNGLRRPQPEDVDAQRRDPGLTAATARSTPATMPRAWEGTPGRRASAGRPEACG